MVEVGLAEGKYPSLGPALEDRRVDPINEVNHLIYNLIQGERDGISLASPDEEAIEVDHLLVEPSVIRTLEDDAMYLSSKGLENCLNVGGTPGCYNHGYDFGILDADAEQVGRRALKYEFMLEGTEENDNLYATCNLSCDCSDYLLESVSAENSLLDYPSNSDTTVRNMESTSQIQCTESCSDEIKSSFPHIAKTFAITTLLDHTTVALDSKKDYECHDSLHSTVSPNASLEAQTWIMHEFLFDQQNSTGSGNVSYLKESAFLSGKNEDDMILIPGNEMYDRVFSSLASMPHTGALVTSAAKDELPCGNRQAVLIELSEGINEMSGGTNDSVTNTKRLRKPTRRYIEETSEIKRRCSIDRLKMSFTSSKEKLLHSKTEGKYHWSGAMQLLYQDCPGRVHSLRGRQRKSTKQFENDGKGYILLPSESVKMTSTFYESEVEDEYPTTIIGRRRKHHRAWILSEVVKLVDGVSHYGVGRWTQIKTHFFSASAYRTAVDLKDKWRNLSRASVSYSSSENRSLKHASASIPQSILQRVRELSNIDPYPRRQKLRIASTSDASVHLGGRILHLRRRLFS